MADRSPADRADSERDRAVRRWDMIYGRNDPNNTVHYMHKLIDVYSDELTDVTAWLDNINGMFVDYNDLDEALCDELRSLTTEDAMVRQLRLLLAVARATLGRIELLVQCEDVGVLVDDLRDAIQGHDADVGALIDDLRDAIQGHDAE